MNKVRNAPAVKRSGADQARRARRHARDRRLKFVGIAAIAFAILFLCTLLFSIISKGYTAFWQTQVLLDVELDAAEIDPKGNRDPRGMRSANYDGMIKASLRELFPEVSGRGDKRKLYRLVSPGAGFELYKRVAADPALIGTTISVRLPANDDIDLLVKGRIDRDVPEDERRVTDRELAWVDRLVAEGRMEKRFNTTFFTAGDSREPELSGIGGAVLGSLFALLVTLMLSFPLGVAAAIYLEEFAPRNKLTDLIEVNINNLAAVPSIIFGLLGLAVFINFVGLPRSVPLVGGLVLTLMTLPTIIISSRAALKAVPPSIREAALGMGASKIQMVFHHVLPLAIPGMLTGTIIGMAQALGESAPLLMIGMVAFIVELPVGVTDPATALPVQIYIWADSPERAFVERTSAAIMVLLAFLVTMNSVAIFLRKRFERRW